MQPQDIVFTVQRWVKNIVVDLNLCPFAGHELRNNRIRFAVTESSTVEQLLEAMVSELDRLSEDPAIETTVLIHPRVLQDFLDYNQFLDIAEELLQQMGLRGMYQIASFHPEYQFVGTAVDDAENYTNRSPYPLLHILREESLERSIEAYPNVDNIPARNIEYMNSIGRQELQKLMRDC